jgi:hypothetical protein
MPPIKKSAKKSTAKKSTAKKSTAKKAAAKKTTRSTATRSKMAQSQQARRAVSSYLDALHTPKRRGRPVSVSDLQAKLRAAEATVSGAKGLARLDAIVKVTELEQRLAGSQRGGAVDIKALAANFAKVAKSYGERKGVTYGMWRRAGVPADVLAKAGIKRTRG